VLRVDFNVEIVNQTIKLYPDLWIELQRRFPKITRWLEQEEKPTLKQLGKLAHFLHIPLGYFLLDEVPPLHKIPIPHFRTKEEAQFQPSLELIDTIKSVRKKQEWARDLLKEFGHVKLPFVGSLDINADIKEAAAKIRETLNLADNWTAELHGRSAALNHLMKKAEGVGIFVIVNSIVDFNPHRPLNVEEFRGFVLSDEYAPFIFINGKDAKSAQLFTLAHELVHVWIGKSASFDLREMMPAKNKIEQFCNSVAAEFLVPEHILRKQYEQYGVDYQALSRYFKVSELVIARRLLDLELIKRNEFLDYYKEYISREIQSRRVLGGDFYETAKYRISIRFARLIHAALLEGRILYRDAYRVTGLYGKTFDEFFGRQVNWYI